MSTFNVYHTGNIAASTLPCSEIGNAEDIRTAIADRALFLVYQGIFRLSSRELTGAEALVRWDHPVRGVLMPIDFIPSAETNGMILPIGEFVLKQAIEQLLAWRQPESENLIMSINVSTLQLVQGNFPILLKECLDSGAISPDRIQLEITETCPFYNEYSVIEKLHELKRLGVRIVLDDFGCGYMSLSRLIAMEVDGIKIDRSFVRSIPGSEKAVAVVTSIIRLAASLNLSITVEGVETEAQACWLNSFDGIYVQGFLYARPQRIFPGTLPPNCELLD